MCDSYYYSMIIIISNTIMFIIISSCSVAIIAACLCMVGWTSMFVHATPCGGEVQHGVTSGISRERCTYETMASAVRCDMVLHRVFSAIHL